MTGSGSLLDSLADALCLARKVLWYRDSCLDSNGVEVGYDRCIDVLGVAMDAVDFVRVCVVVCKDRRLQRVECLLVRFIGHSGEAGKPCVLVHDCVLVSESSCCWCVELLDVIAEMLSWSGGWG